MKKVILIMVYFTLIVSLVACSAPSQSPSAEPIAEPIPTSEPTEKPAPSPTDSPAATPIPKEKPVVVPTPAPTKQAVGEHEAVDFFDISFKYNNKYAPLVEVSDKTIALDFEKGISFVTIGSVSSPDLDDKKSELDITHTMAMGGFGEKQMEETNDLDVAGISGKGSTFVTTLDGTTWYNMMIVTVPTNKTYTIFMYYTNLDNPPEVSHDQEFADMLETIEVKEA